MSDQKPPVALLDGLAAWSPNFKRRLRRLEREGYSRTVIASFESVLVEPARRHGSALEAGALKDAEFIARSLVAMIVGLRAQKDLAVVMRREQMRIVPESEGEDAK